MKRNAQHVVPNTSGGWSVKKSGSTRATKNFKTKNEALNYGKKIAKSQHSSLVVHRKDGRILNSKNFSSTTSPPKSGKNS